MASERHWTPPFLFLSLSLPPPLAGCRCRGNPLGCPFVHVASRGPGDGEPGVVGLAFGSPGHMWAPPPSAPPGGPTPPGATPACPTHAVEGAWEPGWVPVKGGGGRGVWKACRRARFSQRASPASPGSQIFCVGSLTLHENIW